MTKATTVLDRKDMRNDFITSRGEVGNSSRSKHVGYCWTRPPALPHIWARLGCVTESWVGLICDLTAAGNELKRCVQCL